MDYYSVQINESFFATSKSQLLNTPKSVLRDQNYFPKFRDLADDDSDVDLRYQHYISEGVCSAVKTWCLLAEIVDDRIAAWGRHTVQVKDVSGCLFNINFYTDDTEASIPPFFLK